MRKPIRIAQAPSGTPHRSNRETLASGRPSSLLELNYMSRPAAGSVGRLAASALTSVRWLLEPPTRARLNDWASSEILIANAVVDVGTHQRANDRSPETERGLSEDRP